MTDTKTPTPRSSVASSRGSPNSQTRPPTSSQFPTSAPNGIIGKPPIKRTEPNENSSYRKASPEGEAVVSSDDELDQSKLGFLPNSKLNGISQLSSRRPSYAAEFQNRGRTYSISGGGPLSPTTSHPSTPSGDAAAWSAGVTASPTTASPFNSLWGGGIWNDSARKSPPKALGGSNSLFSGSEALPSPTSLAPGGSDFPIPIPLQPQYRNYRSMSFSVGQMELDEQNRSRLSPPSHNGAARAPLGLQHRPSRPSLLSEEVSSSPLRAVNESEDDEEDPKDVIPPHTATSSYFPGQLGGFSRVKYDAMRLRNRSASAATIPTLGLTNGLGHVGLNSTGTIDDICESALAEDDDWNLEQFQAEQRRFSEAPRAMSLMYTPNEPQRLEALRRQYWASAANNIAAAEGSQSRRHSFAGVPGVDHPEAEFGLSSDFLAKRAETNAKRGNNYLSLTDVSNFDTTRKDPLYLNDENRIRSQQRFSTVPPSISQVSGPTGPHHMQQMTGYVGRHSPPNAAQRSMMGMPLHSQQRGQQLLYFVTFKACRGDVFYVQEGTGLRVRVGDLVIVEADRGTDLGTVFAENITWAQAKELKEQHAKEQYRVLMMYASRTAGAAGASNTAAMNGMNGQANGAPGFANGAPGLGPGHHQPGQDTSTAELKPKMIKRLAQPHEIQTLRDKEANEAKAKRVCQQKVLEHRLPMEILDAEFQMDWKKLTFYYFADSYINFNSLVTDLFKVYKTRIWMSAMNPASFAHPTAGPAPPLPSPLGPASMGHGLNTIGENSKDMTPQQFSGINPNYNGFSAPTGPLGMGHGPRAHPHQNSLHHHAPPHSSMTGFPSRRSPHPMESQYALSGYVPSSSPSAAAFQNSMGMGTPQGLFGPQDPLNTSAADQVWMNLQGLSLNSH
ncbi:hypothetical protein EX30DRAFT_350007 [Ascodesmis nigricans]|uniref:PSP1 C-terminal domain-containing protein n=1 Tax=Ascodesmis nigricans TaxID=341454 RepID=A0A4S2MTG6_9PEZI|nr:hypothetical protein EX30DRAFT_350007 [Ascodesmis nigricans]